MRFILISVLFIFKSITFIYAQDLEDLLDAEMEENKEKEFITAHFKGTRIVLGQSIENMAKNELNFLISHHFGTLNSGAYYFWGLDQSAIRLGFEYGINDRLTIGIGRSSYNKLYDGNFKLKILRQHTGQTNMPLSVSFFSNMVLNSLNWANPERDNLFSSRLSYAFQLLMARKFSPSFSLQLTPTMIHRNLVKTIEDDNDVFSIGLGSRIKLTKWISVNLEYFYLLPGKTADDFENSFSLGFDLETGGHVFQIFFTNSNGMVEQAFITETTGKWEKGDVRLGFNISRVFSLGKNKTINIDEDY